MAKKKTNTAKISLKGAKPKPPGLFTSIKNILRQAQNTSYKAVNSMMVFYLTFPEIRSTLWSESAEAQILSTLWRELSWSQYKLLMRVENPDARAYYIREAIEQNWGVRGLEQQIRDED